MHSHIKVIIPIYQTPLSTYEEMSVKQAANVFQQYPISFVIPRGMSHDYLHSLIYEAEIEEVTDEWLGVKNGIAGYNHMMMAKEFYDLFADYEYILICQPDVWVFRDELKAWCDKGYDYVGAPWPRQKKYDKFFPKTWLKLQRAFHPQRIVHRIDTLGKIGNGGFSLRRVPSFREACVRYEKLIAIFCKHRHHLYNEDVFWAVIPKEFKYPDVEEAMSFSFDVKPHILYQMNGEKLPFACHGWTKPKFFKFWKDFIPVPQEP